MNSIIFEKAVEEKKAILQEVSFPNFNSSVKVFLKREDLVHPYISGNKWRKLKYNLIEAKKNEHDTLLTFGGAYSNHVYAVAAAGNLFGFNTIGIIRGEEHLPLNPTLRFAAERGMKLHYLDRTTYRRRNDPDFIETVYNKFGKIYLLPEGGTNLLAVKGCTEIIDSIENDFDYICCPCGTGGTLTGLIAGLKGSERILGFSVLRGASFLIRDVFTLVKNFSGEEYNNWDINLDYHFGGYAKIKPELIYFVNEFEEINNIKLDTIYAGKMMCGIFDLIKNRFFSEGSTVIAIHTGGLQGNAGMQKKIDKLLATHTSTS